ncbi:hypothetical protein BDV12DRAFT_197558 [Aspergillus spectabilis]
MPSDTLPITLAAFAEAIKELTLPTLYAKVAELRNSISHLQRSNQELRIFVAESCENEADKRELEGYISENEGVMQTMNERVHLCKKEVEERGQMWIELDTEPSVTTAGEGEQAQAQEQGQPGGLTTTTTTAAANGTGSSTDAPPAERSRDREDDGGEDGVYL